MFTAKQQRPTQEFPWRTFPRFYRPWRLAAISHHDVVLLPDISCCVAVPLALECEPPTPPITKAQAALTARSNLSHAFSIFRPVCPIQSGKRCKSRVGQPHIS